MPTTNSAKKPKGMNKKSLQHFEKRLLEAQLYEHKQHGKGDASHGSRHAPLLHQELPPRDDPGAFHG